METYALFGLSDDNFARLVYLLCVLLLVAGGVRFARGRLGYAVRQAAIWIGLILALVAAYTYRDPVMRLVAPVISELDPSRTTVVIDENGRDMLVYSRSADGHFHIGADVNGVGIDFLVDTGATSTVLSHQDAMRVGIEVETLAFNRPVQTANGVTFAATTRVETLEIGPFSLRNVRLGVMQPGQLSGSLLGLNVLDRFASLQVSGNRLTLTPSTH